MSRVIIDQVNTRVIIDQVNTRVIIDQVNTRVIIDQVNTHKAYIVKISSPKVIYCCMNESWKPPGGD